jgi:hypothetical protein
MAVTTITGSLKGAPTPEQRAELTEAAARGRALSAELSSSGGPAVST